MIFAKTISLCKDVIGMLTVAICDDEASVLAGLETMTRRCLEGGEHQLRAFGSREGLTRAVAEGWTPDVALLDIRMTGEDGIRLAKRLFPEGSRTQVIFVTGYPEYLTEVYETEHVWTLIKPVREEALRRALEKASRRMEERRTRTLPVHTGGTVRQIPLEEIRCAEASGRKVLLRCREEQVEYYGTLDDLARRLPDRFVRCHRSYILNLAWVNRLERDWVVLSGGETVPVGRTRRSAVRAAFLDYLRREG